MSNKKGLLALSPLFLLILLIAVFTIHSVRSNGSGDNLSLTVAFMISSIYAVAISGGLPIKKRIDTYSRGAGASNLMLMLWIYVLAGAFAASAKAMGAVDATVNLGSQHPSCQHDSAGTLPAACFISLSIGTSVGTVVALVPIAAGLALSVDANIGLTVAVIVGGAYFGDNLSFISDTTVVATQTQECRMSDKFRINSLIVVPAAIIILIVYAIMGAETKAPTQVAEVEYIKVIPYLPGSRHSHCRHERDGCSHYGNSSLRSHRHHRKPHGNPKLIRFLRLVLGHGKRSHQHGRTRHHCHDGWWNARNHQGERRHQLYHQQDNCSRQKQAGSRALDCCLSVVRQPLYGQQYRSDSYRGKYLQEDRRQVRSRQPKGRKHPRHFLVLRAGTHPVRRTDAPGSRTGAHQPHRHSSLSLLPHGHRRCGTNGHSVQISTALQLIKKRD